MWSSTFRITAVVAYVAAFLASEGLAAIRASAGDHIVLAFGAGVRWQYTGYNAPDDNAYVERVIRTVKEEKVWPNLYDSLSEARSAMEDYINYYNNERIHSALGYQTPSEFAAAHNTLAAA